MFRTFHVAVYAERSATKSGEVHVSRDVHGADCVKDGHRLMAAHGLDGARVSATKGENSKGGAMVTCREFAGA
jgi:hypothetical protein